MTDTRSSPGSASAREKVAAFLLARDENYAATPHMLAWAEKLIRDCKDAEHDGDCTNKSHTCHRCTADQALDDADKIIALTPIGVAQRSPRRVDDHMMRARRLVENHIEAFGMVPHPDLIKDAIADMSQQSFDLGFRAAGGSVSLPSTEGK